MGRSALEQWAHSPKLGIGPPLPRPTVQIGHLPEDPMNERERRKEWGAVVVGFFKRHWERIFLFGFSMSLVSSLGAYLLLPEEVLANVPILSSILGIQSSQRAPSTPEPLTFAFKSARRDRAANEEEDEGARVDSRSFFKRLPKDPLKEASLQYVKPSPDLPSSALARQPSSAEPPTDAPKDPEKAEAEKVTEELKKNFKGVLNVEDAKKTPLSPMFGSGKGNTLAVSGGTTGGGGALPVGPGALAKAPSERFPIGTDASALQRPSAKGRTLTAFQSRRVRGGIPSQSAGPSRFGSRSAIFQTGSASDGASRAATYAAAPGGAETAATTGRGIYTGEAQKTSGGLSVNSGSSSGGGSSTSQNLQNTQTCKNTVATLGPQQAQTMQDMDAATQTLDKDIKTLQTYAQDADGVITKTDATSQSVGSKKAKAETAVQEHEQHWQAYLQMKTELQQLESSLGNKPRCCDHSQVDAYNQKIDKIIALITKTIAHINDPLLPSTDYAIERLDKLIAKIDEFEGVVNNELKPAVGKVTGHIDTVVVPGIENLEKLCKNYNGLAGQVAADCGPNGQGAKTIDCQVYAAQKQTFLQLRAYYVQAQQKYEAMLPGFDEVKAEAESLKAKYEGQKGLIEQEKIQLEAKLKDYQKPDKKVQKCDCGCW